MNPATASLSESEMRATVLELLSHVAPEADPSSLDPDGNLQEQLDIDSIDFLNFVMSVHEATGIDIAERDYAKIATLNDCVRYLLGKAA